MAGAPAAQCRKSCRCPDDSAPTRRALRAGSAPTPARLAPYCPGEISAQPRFPAACQTPCKPHPSRQHRVSPQRESERWSGQSSENSCFSERQPESERLVVQRGIPGGFGPLHIRWLWRSQNVQDSRAIPVLAKVGAMLQLEHHVLVANAADQRAVSCSIFLYEHVEAHHALATHRNPDVRSLRSAQ